MKFPVEVFAPAKINLFLDVLDRREDGFHNLRSVMQTVALADRLEFMPGGQGITLECDDPRVPTDESNLVARALRLLVDEAGISPNWRVTLDKRIPMGAGLGGGSADAAAVLTGLPRHVRITADAETRLGWAMQLGSDVPFACVGGTAIVEGKGERVLPLPAGGHVFHYTLVSPDCHCPTGELYAALPPHGQRPHPGISPILAAIRAADLPALGACLFNAFEPVVVARFPELASLKQELLAAGALGAVMTGSGSNFIALAQDSAHAEAIAAEVASQGWQARAVSGPAPALP